MKFLRTLSIILPAATLFLFACVTINIYFPAEKVESVAGEIVDEIRGKKGDAGEGSKTPDKTSFLHRTLFSFSISRAWADEVTTVSNPTIRALKESMKSRFAQMKTFYESGALKEGNDGYVSLGNTEGLGLKEKRDLKNLVDAENQDRKALYGEVAKALNIDPAQIGKVAEIFAKEWQKSVQ